jgi:arginine decarboxylase
MASRKDDELPTMTFSPTRIFFSRGVGVHSIQRVAVQRAMEDAGVQDLNLVKVTSVIPARCEVITSRHGLRLLEPGSVCFGVIAQGETNEPHQRVTAALCWGQPIGDDLPGYITEIEEEQTKGKSEKTAVDEAGQALVHLFGDKIGANVNAERVWGARGQSRYIRVGGRRIRVGSIVSSAVGTEEQDGEKKYTVVLAVAVYL